MENNSILAACFALALILSMHLPLPACAGDLIKSYQVENAVYKACSEAVKFMDSKNYAQARDLLIPAAAQDPTSYSADVHSELAQCMIALNDNSQAIAEAQAALRFNPNKTSALYTMACAYEKQREYDAARKCMRKYIAAQFEPDSSPDYSLFKEVSAHIDVQEAIGFEDAGSLEKARKLFQDAAKYDPTPVSAVLHSHLCFVFRHLNEEQAAVEEGLKALQYDPNDKSAMIDVALAYDATCKFDEAARWIQKYLSVETDSEQRRSAEYNLKVIEYDKVDFQNPANKEADYLQQSGEIGSNRRWKRDRLPIKVCITSGQGVPGFRKTFSANIIRGLDAWCDGCGKKLNYSLVSDPDHCDLKVVWTDAPLHSSQARAGLLVSGLTQDHPDPGDDGTMISSVVTISTVDPFNPKKGITDGECASVCTHEIGHALGLGHSTCISDIMYYRGGGSAKLSKRDRATLARIYKDYPVVAFTPNIETTSPSVPIKFMPAPVFFPAKPRDNSKIAPPLFMPPPIRSESQKLQAPLFVPPPINSTTKTTQPNARPSNASLFMAPATSKTQAKPKNNGTQAQPPFFMPPPAR